MVVKAKQQMAPTYLALSSDRIMWKSTGNKWEVAAVDLIGTDPCLTDGDQPIFPSDHFGVVCTLAYNTEDSTPKIGRAHV